MRWKLSTGVLIALAFLIPAAPAVAQSGPTGLNAACQTVDRKVFKDVRQLVTIDLDTATNVQLRVLANQILAVALAESLPVLPDAIQKGLDGTTDDLRAFLKTGLQDSWTTSLHVLVVQTLTDAGPKVKAAAQETLDAATVDGYLAYLNDGLYAARALDCASQATSTPTANPTTTPTAATGPTSSAGAGAGAGGTAGGEGGGGLAVTGANTGTAVAIGGALLLLGGAGFLIGRRRRSRFVA